LSPWVVTPPWALNAQNVLRMTHPDLWLFRYGTLAAIIRLLDGGKGYHAMNGGCT
jgi:hypothetical protein